MAGLARDYGFATDFASGTQTRRLIDSPRYQAAAAYHALHSATRQSGTTGPEALAGLATLELRLRRLGVENPGVNEQLRTACRVC